MGRDAYAVVVLVRGDAELATLTLSGEGRPDLGVVDGLARMQVNARGLGCSIRLRDVSLDLWGLLELVGLTDAITDPAWPSG